MCFRFKNREAAYTALNEDDDVGNIRRVCGRCTGIIAIIVFIGLIILILVLLIHNIK